MNGKVEGMKDPGVLRELSKETPNHRESPPGRVRDRDVQAKIRFGPKRSQTRDRHSAKLGVFEEVTIIVQANEVGEENRRQCQRRDWQEKYEHSNRIRDASQIGLRLPRGQHGGTITAPSALQKAAAAE